MAKFKTSGRSSILVPKPRGILLKPERRSSKNLKKVRFADQRTPSKWSIHQSTTSCTTGSHQQTKAQYFGRCTDQTSLPGTDIFDSKYLSQFGWTRASLEMYCAFLNGCLDDCFGQRAERSPKQNDLQHHNNALLHYNKMASSMLSR